MSWRRNGRRWAACHQSLGEIDFSVPLEDLLCRYSPLDFFIAESKEGVEQAIRTRLAGDEKIHQIIDAQKQGLELLGSKFETKLGQAEEQTKEKWQSFLRQSEAVERSIGEVRIELAQQIKAQKESEVRGREAVERSIGEVKIELAQQIKAQKESEVRGRESVERSIGEVKGEPGGLRRGCAYDWRPRPIGRSGRRRSYRR